MVDHPADAVAIQDDARRRGSQSSLTAAHASAGVLILEDHIGEWVREAIEASAAEEKVDELVASIRR
jgi:hypothetical protein